MPLVTSICLRGDAEPKVRFMASIAASDRASSTSEIGGGGSAVEGVEVGDDSEASLKAWINLWRN